MLKKVQKLFFVYMNDVLLGLNAFTVDFVLAFSDKMADTSDYYLAALSLPNAIKQF